MSDPSKKRILPVTGELRRALATSKEEPKGFRWNNTLVISTAAIVLSGIAIIMGLAPVFLPEPQPTETLIPAETEDVVATTVAAFDARINALEQGTATRIPPSPTNTATMTNTPTSTSTSTVTFTPTPTSTPEEDAQAQTDSITTDGNGTGDAPVNEATDNDVESQTPNDNTADNSNSANDDEASTQENSTATEQTSEVFNWIAGGSCARGCNIRQAANASATIIDALAEGEQISIVGYLIGENVDGVNSWFQVTFVSDTTQEMRLGYLWAGSVTEAEREEILRSVPNLTGGQ